MRAGDEPPSRPASRRGRPPVPPASAPAPSAVPARPCRRQSGGSSLRGHTRPRARPARFGRCQRARQAGARRPAAWHGTFLCLPHQCAVAVKGLAEGRAQRHRVAVCVGSLAQIVSRRQHPRPLGGECVHRRAVAPAGDGVADFFGNADDRVVVRSGVSLGLSLGCLPIPVAWAAMPGARRQGRSVADARPRTFVRIAPCAVGDVGVTEADWRAENLARFYKVQRHLETASGAKGRLSDCDGTIQSPIRGVYFFEAGKCRSISGAGSWVQGVGVSCGQRRYSHGFQHLHQLI